MTFKNLFKKRENPVYTALMEGIETMENAGVDRVVLSVHETEPVEHGLFLVENCDTHDTCYYPFELLDPREQRMILAGKTYKVLALVLVNVGGLVEYGDPGVESYTRTRIFPNLCDLSPESNFYYTTNGGIYCERLGEFSEAARESGWKPGMIKRIVELGFNFTKKKQGN